MNKRNLLALVLLSLTFAAGCGGSGGNATPTRTPRAIAQGDATQTPWIIYVPITTTPEPPIATPLPTVTPGGPTRTATRPPAPPTNTPGAPAPTRPPAAAPTATVPAPTAGPANTPVPTCGQTYSVGQLTFPENGATRTTKEHPGANKTVEFMWTPAVDFEIDPKIGYEVSIASYLGTGAKQINGAALYISHNGYLQKKKAILDENATYGLTRGDDVNVRWSVRVVMASGGFDDSGFKLLGTATACGPASGQFNFILAIVS